MAPGLRPVHSAFGVTRIHYCLGVKLPPAQLTAHLRPRSSPQMLLAPPAFLLWSACRGQDCPLLLPQLHGAPVGRFVSTDPVTLDGGFPSHTSTDSPTLGIIC